MNERGRSMVEMLGVLAIIGVLSVGAIAGYSKAMMKYKFNKQTQQINGLMNSFLTYRSRLKTGNIMPILVKLGSLPEGMTLSDKNSHAYDVFNVRYEIFYYGDGQSYSFTMTVPTTESGVELCQNIVSVVKWFRRDIYQMWIDRWSEGDKESGEIHLLGDQVCNYRKSNYCLKNASLELIRQVCQFCSEKQGDYCYITFTGI